MAKLTTQQKKKRLRNKADKIYQEIGKMLYDKTGCLICGGSYSCLHHYYPKSTCSALRYNLSNGIPICQKCHCRIHSSDDPTINNIIIKKRGLDWLEGLEVTKRTTFIRNSMEYYEQIIKSLSIIYGIKK